MKIIGRNSRRSLVNLLFFPGLACLAFAMMPGCTSVGTYEARMKACRDAMARTNEMEGQVYSLKEKNRQLEFNMGIAEREQEEMRDTIQTQEEYITNLRGTYDQLINEFKDDIARGGIDVKNQTTGLSIVLDENVLFRSGAADLMPEGQVVLMRIGGILKDVKDNYLRIDGHTDNLPVRGRLKNKYPTNWELSAARAASVLRFFQDRAGLDPGNMFLAVFGQYVPIADNRTEKGRELNRRVVVSLIKK